MSLSRSALVVFLAFSLIAAGCGGLDGPLAENPADDPPERVSTSTDAMDYLLERPDATAFCLWAGAATTTLIAFTIQAASATGGCAALAAVTGPGEAVCLAPAGVTAGSGILALGAGAITTLSCLIGEKELDLTVSIPAATTAAATAVKVDEAEFTTTYASTFAGMLQGNCKPLRDLAALVSIIPETAVPIGKGGSTWYTTPIVTCQDALGTVTWPSSKIVLAGVDWKCSLKACNLTIPVFNGSGTVQVNANIKTLRLPTGTLDTHTFTSFGTTTFPKTPRIHLERSNMFAYPVTPFLPVGNPHIGTVWVNGKPIQIFRVL